MAEYQKFIFSENYSTAPENLQKIQEKKLAEAQQMLSEDMEKAKQHAFEQGFQEGQKMALEKLKSEMDLHLNTILENITKINEFKPQIHDLFEQQATACVRHLVTNLYFKSEELFPQKLLEQAIENALINLPMVLKIAIKVPASSKRYIEDTQIEDNIRQRGVTDFVILEDPHLNPGECRIEWDTSGILSSKIEAFEKINSTLHAFLSPEDIELSDNIKSLAQEDVTANQEPEENNQEKQEDIQDDTSQDTTNLNDVANDVAN